MKKLRKWLLERYFPAEAKEAIARLEREIARKDGEISALNAYIDGLEYGMRAQRRITINNNAGRDKD